MINLVVPESADCWHVFVATRVAVAITEVAINYVVDHMPPATGVDRTHSSQRVGAPQFLLKFLRDLFVHFEEFTFTHLLTALWPSYCGSCGSSCGRRCRSDAFNDFSRSSERMTVLVY